MRLDDAFRALRALDPGLFDPAVDPDPGGAFNPADWAGPCTECTDDACPYGDTTEYLR
jgi:hypothetical protein